LVTRKTIQFKNGGSYSSTSHIHYWHGHLSNCDGIGIGLTFDFFMSHDVITYLLTI